MKKLKKIAKYSYWSAFWIFLFAAVALYLFMFSPACGPFEPSASITINDKTSLTLYSGSYSYSSSASLKPEGQFITWYQKNGEKDVFVRDRNNFKLFVRPSTGFISCDNPSESQDFHDKTSIQLTADDKEIVLPKSSKTYATYDVEYPQDRLKLDVYYGKLPFFKKNIASATINIHWLTPEEFEAKKVELEGEITN